MFTIFTKNVEGRETNRYFKEWDNAREAMEADIKMMKELGLAQVLVRRNEMNEDKGFYVYEAEGILNHKGEKITWALFETTFEDAR